MCRSIEWHDFFTTDQSEFFHRAAILHEYIKPETLLLEDALSVNTGRPRAGSTSCKDFSSILPLTVHHQRHFPVTRNVKATGPYNYAKIGGQRTRRFSNPQRIKVDEKAGICVTTCPWGSVTVTHLFSSTSLWCLPKVLKQSLAEARPLARPLQGQRLTSDFAAEDEVAADLPPSDKQMAASADAAEEYQPYAPRGQFWPWALLRLLEFADVYRLMYPILISANCWHAFLHDVRTGSLVQNGSEVLRMPAKANARCSQRVEDPYLISGDWFLTPLSVSSEIDEYTRPMLIAAHASRDGRDLVILSEKRRLVFIRD
ncbi:hypothetical protein EI94DRAFT_1700314 [Lactarius quietus]|nr:hypothetical protein EI94DRAFT_1700314 [Lactarius quietus]